MRRGRLIFVVALLAGFAALRYYPGALQRLRAELGEVISGDAEYIEAIEAMGSSFIESIRNGELRQTMNEELHRADEFIENAREQWRQALEPPEEAAPAEMAEPEEGELPAVVSAFIAEQLSFSQSVPENVRMDMPLLPFEYACPVEGSGSSGFGFREHPIEQGIKFHFGTDFAANGGTAVSAFASGKVIAVGKDEGYGNYIVISHGAEAETLYAHLSRICVSEGEEVELGQLIGQVGATGLTTGPHLHFELKLEDYYLNPEFYL